ncbi:MAG: ABC transporter permease [Firmicutes bacterium]|nr:ABC transporter permease [Bacillota bacterium]
MRISENFTMAVKNLRSNLVRSVLTMLGVIIGVTAVIIMVSLGEGAKQQITQRITAQGSNLLILSPGRGDRREGGAFGSAATLTNKILPVIQNCSPYIQAIAPEARSGGGGGGYVKAGSYSYQTSIIGCTAAYFPVRNYEVELGLPFTDADVEGRRRIAVLGSYVAEQLFPGVNPVGREIKIGNLRVTVIGVLKSKGQSGFMNSDDLILMPLYTVQQRLRGNKNLNTIYIQIKSDQLMGPAYEQINAALLNYFEGDDTKFNIMNQADMLSMMQDATQTFTLLLAGIAAVSLLVGGIGIMNIMLVSVTERIKEIGIRKAIGAQKEEILALFLIEAVVLSVLGGVTGILLGWFFGSVIAGMIGWNAVITMTSVLVSFLFSVFIGLFFGVYPAYKAAGLHPIDALRYE